MFKFFLGNGYFVIKNQHATKNQNRRDKALPCLCYHIFYHNHRAVAVQRLYVLVRVVVSAALNDPYPERSRRVFIRTGFLGLKNAQDYWIFQSCKFHDPKIVF